MKTTVGSSGSEAPADPPRQTLLPVGYSREIANSISQAPLPAGFLLDSASERRRLEVTRPEGQAGGLRP